jgi:hypothetical protein
MCETMGSILSTTKKKKKKKSNSEMHTMFLLNPLGFFHTPNLGARL